MATRSTITTTKARLIRRIRATSNLSLLRYVDGLMESSSEEWWDSLPTAVKASIKRGEAQADRGELVPDAAVRKQIREWIRR